MADLGEGSPLFLVQTEKKILRLPPSPLSQGLDDQDPPSPPPLSEGVDPPLLSHHNCETPRLNKCPLKNAQTHQCQNAKNELKQEE